MNKQDKFNTSLKKIATTKIKKESKIKSKKEKTKIIKNGKK